LSFLNKMGVLCDIEKNEIYISLNKEFYNIQAIKEAIIDFEEICDGELNEDIKNYTLILKLKEQNDLCNIGYEFCNYVLGLIKNEYLI